MDGRDALQEAQEELPQLHGGDKKGLRFRVKGSGSGKKRACGLPMWLPDCLAMWHVTCAGGIREVSLAVEEPVLGDEPALEDMALHVYCPKHGNGLYCRVLSDLRGRSHRRICL